MRICSYSKTRSARSTQNKVLICMSLSGTRFLIGNNKNYS